MGRVEPSGERIKEWIDQELKLGGGDDPFFSESTQFVKSELVTQGLDQVEDLFSDLSQTFYDLQGFRTDLVRTDLVGFVAHSPLVEVFQG